MERVNRLISFLTRNNLVNIMCLDKIPYEEIDYYSLRVTLNTQIDDLIKKLEEFLNNGVFDFYYYKDNIITFMCEDLLIVRIDILTSIYEKIAIANKKNVYNPRNTSYDKEKNYNSVIDCINEMLISFDEYMLYLQTKENILAFNSLMKADNAIIKLLFALLLDLRINGSLEDIYNIIGEEKTTEFKNYHLILNSNRMIEASKMMIWFINDFIVNIPISVASQINLDFYINIKKNITTLKSL